ncbi:MAG: PRC-barrel domain containing protein [Acidobacteriota bacterium]
MSTPKIHFEMLLGRMVRDPDGVAVGRIFAAHAEIEGGDCVLREFLLGPGALLERFGFPLGRWRPTRVPWDLLDIADPGHPRLRCSAAELAGRRP